MSSPKSKDSSSKGSSSSRDPATGANFKGTGFLRADDPMLAYYAELEGAREKGAASQIPTFKGRYPPNRYNIKPGYRWDGVNRSNGHEKAIIEREANKKAREEELHRSATRDL